MTSERGPKQDGPRLAAIDVGTNSIRLVVAAVEPGRGYRVVDDEKVGTRLGRGLHESGRLSQQAMEESAQAIAHLRSIAEGFDVKLIRAAATCAVRVASNGAQFVELVREQAGLELEVLPPEAEARLAFRSVSAAFDLRSTAAAVIDVGGGSTEIVLSSGEVIERICPLPLGAVQLSERYDLSDDITTERYKKARRAVKRNLRDIVGKPPFAPHLVVGTGGTFTNLAAMSMHRGSAGGEGDVHKFAVRGYEMHRSEVKHFLDLLRKLPLRERARVAGLSRDRADIIVGGLLIVDCALKHLEANLLRVHDQGIRAGLLYEMMDRLPAARGRRGDGVRDRLRGVHHFAAACRHEPRHADHVAHLALALFDGLARETESADWATPENREILHAAALLHDVGYLINYTRHHKHTYHLIIHSGLAGFTRRELELVANIARYHRGARPKGKHANFAAMSVDDQSLVRRLAGLLRLAVGLDRSHAQRVRDVNIRCYDGTALIEVEAEEDPGVELWGAQRKARLFRSAFHLDPRFRWTAAPAPIGPAEGNHDR